MAAAVFDATGDMSLHSAGIDFPSSIALKNLLVLSASADWNTMPPFVFAIRKCSNNSSRFREVFQVLQHTWKSAGLETHTHKHK